MPETQETPQVKPEDIHFSRQQMRNKLRLGEDDLFRAHQAAIEVVIASVPQLAADYQNGKHQGSCASLYRCYFADGRPAEIVVRDLHTDTPEPYWVSDGFVRDNFYTARGPFAEGIELDRKRWRNNLKGM